MARRRNDRSNDGQFVPGVFKTYYATAEINLGFLSNSDHAINMREGDSLETDGTKVRLMGMEKHAPQIRGAIIKGFFSEDEFEEYIPRPAITEITGALPDQNNEHYKVPLSFEVRNTDGNYTESRKDQGNVNVSSIRESKAPSADRQEFEEFLAWKQKKAEASAPASKKGKPSPPPPAPVKLDVEARRRDRASTLREKAVIVEDQS